MNSENIDRYSYHPVPGEAILKCATGGAGPFPVINTVLSDPIPVVSVNIDTTRMYKPTVLLTFTGIVSLPVGVSVTLNFIIKRSRDGEEGQQIGGTYTFSTLAAVLESEAFSFQFCDCNPCAGCYTYTVEISTNSVIDVVPGLTVPNATLSALAVDGR